MRTWRPRRPVVLILDDDPDILKVLSLCLSAENCEVRETVSTADALESLDRIDVIVVDQRMPSMTGTEFIAAARAKGYAGRILVISGSRSARFDAANAHTDGFLAKPIGPRELIGEVERLFYLNTALPRAIGCSARTSVVPTKS